jgi:hypothetical protein
MSYYQIPTFCTNFSKRFFLNILKANKKAYGGIMPVLSSTSSAKDIAQDEIDNVILEHGMN